MSDPRSKWNKIYEKRRSKHAPPTEIVRDFGHLMPRSGRALDIACGLGANSFFMARRGLAVDAWDISDIATSSINERRGPFKIDAKPIDITPASLESSRWDVIVVSRYLDRALAPAIVDALKPGGLLFYQTFTQARLPGAGGPSNPAFLLAEGELLELFGDLRVVAYYEPGSLGDTNADLRNEAQLVAARPHQT